MRNLRGGLSLYNAITVDVKKVWKKMEKKGIRPERLQLAWISRRGPDFVLADDLTLRQAIDNQKQRPMGSSGLLLHACKVGLLNREELDQSIDRLFVHSTLKFVKG